MKNKSWMVMVLPTIFCTSVMADEVTLKCTPDKTNIVVDVVVNLEKKLLKFGDSKYDIARYNDEHISAYQKLYKSNVGGEILVLNRITGKYKRASVFMARTSTDPKEKSFILSDTFDGHCVKRLL